MDESDFDDSDNEMQVSRINQTDRIYFQNVKFAESFFLGNGIATEPTLPITSK